MRYQGLVAPLPGGPIGCRFTAWVYAFDLDATATISRGPIVLSKIVATDAQSMSYYALEVAPAAALDNIGSPTGMLSLLARRLVRLWPKLAATLTA